MSGRKVKKLVIESHDEIYYPSVVFTKTAKPSVGEPSHDLPQASRVTRHRRRGLQVWTSGFGTIVTVAAAVLAITLAGLRLFGFRTFTIMSGSMEPNYPVGSMIYVRPVDYQTLKVGDVISYVAGDDKTIVTHRIIEIEPDSKDASVLRFRTKGDANELADTKLVHYKNVLGVPVFNLPHLGYFARNIQEPPGIYITLVVGTLLLAWTFLPGTLEGRRKTASKSLVSKL